MLNETPSGAVSMAEDKIRFYVVKRQRAFWQPTAVMRRHGFSPKPLGEAGPAAQAEALNLNDKWDQFRFGIDLATQPRYPRGSIGEAWKALWKTLIHCGQLCKDFLGW